MKIEYKQTREDDYDPPLEVYFGQYKSRIPQDGSWYVNRKEGALYDHKHKKRASWTPDWERQTFEYFVFNDNYKGSTQKDLIQYYTEDYARLQRLGIDWGYCILGVKAYIKTDAIGSIELASAHMGGVEYSFYDREDENSHILEIYKDLHAEASAEAEENLAKLLKELIQEQNNERT